MEHFLESRLSLLVIHFVNRTVLHLILHQNYYVISLFFFLFLHNQLCNYSLCDVGFSYISVQVKLEGDIDQGIALYKKALYYNWHYADAMYNLGVAYGEMLKFDMVNDSENSL